MPALWQTHDVTKRSAVFTTASLRERRIEESDLAGIKTLWLPIRIEDTPIYHVANLLRVGLLNASYPAFLPASIPPSTGFG